MPEISEERTLLAKLLMVTDAHNTSIPYWMRLWIECGKPASAASAPKTVIGEALSAYWNDSYLLAQTRENCLQAMRKAADANCAAACEFLATPEILLGQKSELKRARAYGKKAARLGRSEALANLLLDSHVAGQISLEEFEREIEWASGHDPETCYYVAMRFMKAEEAASAQRWVDRAYRAGSVRAHLDKGLTLWETRRTKEAVEMWYRGAERGDAGCAAELLELFHTDADLCADFCLKEQAYADLVLNGLEPSNLHQAAQTLMERGDLKEALLVYTIASHFSNESDDEDASVYPEGRRLALMFYPDKEGKSPLKPAWDWVSQRLNLGVATSTLAMYAEMWEDARGRETARKFSEEWVQHYEGE